MESETFRQTRKMEDVPKIETPIPKGLPPAVQETLRKHAAGIENDMPYSSPHLAFTGNVKLDELLAGIKEQVYKYEEVILPSLGKFYDESTAPPNGIVHVRCMTGEEEQIFGTPRYIKKGQAINMVFKNCVREPIIPERLLSIDRTWLLIYLRGISYSPTYEVEVRCSECNTKFQTLIDLDSLIVTRCPDNFGQENLTDVLPKSGYKLNYRLATGKDENLIQDHRDIRIRNNTDGGSDDTWTYRASLLITDIESLTDRAAIQTLLSRLPIQDVAYIRTLIIDQPFGVDTKVTILCPNCSEEFQVEMPMDVSFFFPKAKKTKPTQA